MEHIFDYATKSIPIPSQKGYTLKLIQQIEHLLRRMRWAAYFFRSPDAKTDQRESFGFKSSKTRPSLLSIWTLIT